MTSTGRFNLAARLTLPRPGFICLQCRLRASQAVRTFNPSITLLHASRRHAGWTSTEGLRKKIWGSENPPGQEDPYAKESVFDQKRREREQERERGKELEPAPEAEAETLEDETEYMEEATTEGLGTVTTTQGLRTVGGPGWGRKEWEMKEGNSFQGFMHFERTESRNDTILAVHRALVETFALKEAGLPLDMNSSYDSIKPTDEYCESVARGAIFEQDANGRMALVLESEDLRQSILTCVTTQDRSSDDIAREEDTEIDEEVFTEEQMDTREIEDGSSRVVKEDDGSNLELEGSELPVPDEESLDPARSSNLAAFTPPSDTWCNVSLEDAAIKFAVLKRVMRLTGRRIPDPDIAAISTPKSLLVHLIKKPKPKRIAEALLNSNQVAELPNVQILDKRYGAIDREIEVGRWKVIKESLEKRGLPVSGRAPVQI